MELSEKLHKTKKHLFIQEALTGWLNFMHIGLQLIIEKLMVFMHVMVFCLIMKALFEEKHLLQEKLQELLLV